MASQATVPEVVALDGYVTDGRDLFRVADVLPGEAVLLENALGGELVWHALEELASTPLERIVAAVPLAGFAQAS
jgi:hypothetical protein